MVLMQLHSNSPTLQTAAPKAPNNALNATIPFKFMDSHQNFKNIYQNRHLYELILSDTDILVMIS